MAGPLRGRGSPRQQQQREEKLEEIKRQVADGSLVVRKMTARERKRFPKQRGRSGR
jgi:anti-sigma28 factor (negative regulator of flagellin synthesis)